MVPVRSSHEPAPAGQPARFALDAPSLLLHRKVQGRDFARHRRGHPHGRRLPGRGQPDPTACQGPRHPQLHHLRRQNQPGQVGEFRRNRLLRPRRLPGKRSLHLAGLFQAARVRV
uniref:(northern house mosquito) hypothetical protein n=1 Tax=Culex pipiens TaxID=7175 RepID=A0A8D8B8K0_CULPI